MGNGLAVTVMALALLSASFAGAEVPGYRFVWVKSFLGPCCSDGGADLSIDPDGDVFVAGHRGGLDLDRDGSVDIQTHGSPDTLLFKSNDEGRDRWVSGPGGPEPDSASGLAADRNGGVFVVGSFAKSVQHGKTTLDIAAGSDLSRPHHARTDGYLTRYDGDGEALWAVAIGGTGADTLFDVASDAAGNAYVVGTIQGEVDIDRDGSIDVRATGDSSVLLASFDADGKLRWARASGGAGTERGHGIALGPNGEIYIAGMYMKGPLDLDADGTPEGHPAGAADPDATVTPQTDINGYFARFEPSGKMVWAKLATGPALQILGPLAVTSNGDLLVLGSFNGPVDLDGDNQPEVEFETLDDRKLKYHPDTNTFLARYTPDGSRVWVRRYAAAGTSVSADPTRILMTGVYTGPLDLDDDGRLERAADPDPEKEGFVAILDQKGAIRHVFAVVGGDNDSVNAAGFTPDGKGLYTTGFVRLGADFDGDGKPESNSKCHQLGDVYLAFYDVDETP
jgi:hypothetical protein